jgi:hypothetical protein
MPELKTETILRPWSLGFMSLEEPFQEILENSQTKLDARMHFFLTIGRTFTPYLRYY